MKISPFWGIVRFYERDNFEKNTAYLQLILFSEKNMNAVNNGVAISKQYMY
jgi:hypothetical protein